MLTRISVRRKVIIEIDLLINECLIQVATSLSVKVEEFKASITYLNGLYSRLLY